MKTPQKENKQVGVLIKFVLICMIIIFGGFIVTKCEAQNVLSDLEMPNNSNVTGSCLKIDTGYYIWIRDSQGTI